MTIKISDISNFLEVKAPVTLAEEWDNVGLLIGNSDRSLQKVLVCLDVTKAVVAEAIELKANLIISHHPIIFKGIKSINENTPKGSLIYSIIRNNIAVYCAHTNLDVAEDGVNEQLAKSIELNNMQILSETGLGRYGELSHEMSLSDFISHVKSKLSVENIRLIGNTDKKIKTVAVFCGSFDDNYSDFLKSKADILITGDIKYHTASDMREMGICVIDAGHFYTEKVIVASLVEKLNKAFPQVEVIGSQVEEDPFKFS